MDFPAAARPDERNGLARLDDELDVAEHVELTCRVPVRDPLERDRRERRTRKPNRLDRDGGSLRQVEQSLCDGGAVGARMPLGREVPDRQIELGSEHEHGQGRLEADVPFREPNAHDDGDERDPERRRELQDGAGQEREPQGPHRRRAVLVAHARDALRLNGSAVEGPERRQASHDVEEVVREQRQRLPALTRLPSGLPAHEPHEDRDERKRQDHHAGGQRVDRHHDRQDRDRDDGGEHDLREVSREGRLERVDARDGRRRHLGGLRPVESCGAATEPRVDDVEPQLRDDLGRGPPPGDLEAPCPGCPSDDDEPQQDESRGHVVERRPTERAGRDAREQEGLCQHEQRHHNRKHGVDHEQRSHGTRALVQARVEDTHAREARRRRLVRYRRARGTRSTSSPGTGARAGRRSTPRRSSPGARSATKRPRPRSGCSRSRCSRP